MSGKRPRLGFLGLGWIGQNRMQAILEDGACEVAVVADPSPEVQARLREQLTGARPASTLEDLLAHELDGVVIATPSALHAPQCLQLLDRRIAVFCQKPLARTLQQTQAILDAARRADRLLGCDLSYRHTEAMKRIRNVLVEGEIGNVFAVDLVFHNAYGPNRGWARDMALAGGGCAIDLGTHLVDLALWVLGSPEVTQVASRLYAQGRRLGPGEAVVEDHAVAQFDTAAGTTVRLACSWECHTGRDAIIEAHFHCHRGGASMRNVGGSFFDFRAERFHCTQCTLLA